LRVPLIYNLRLDPYERANITSNTYYDWLLDHAFMLMPAQTYVGQFLRPSRTFHHGKRQQVSRSIRRCRSCNSQAVIKFRGA